MNSVPMVAVVEDPVVDPVAVHQEKQPGIEIPRRGESPDPDEVVIPVVGDVEGPQAVQNVRQGPVPVLPDLFGRNDAHRGRSLRRFLLVSGGADDRHVHQGLEAHLRQVEGCSRRRIALCGRNIGRPEGAKESDRGARQDPPCQRARAPGVPARLRNRHDDSPLPRIDPARRDPGIYPFLSHPGRGIFRVFARGVDSGTYLPGRYWGLDRCV